MKNPQGKSIGAPSARRATSAVAAQLRDDPSFDTDPVLTDPGDAYLNADNGWPATGAEAAALQEEYDALANLFLSDEPQTPVAKATQAAAAAPPRPTPLAPPPLRSPSIAPPVSTRQLPTQGIDCLILGHLPVLASAWSLQYARAAAERTGMPVALVRLSSGSVSIEVVFASPEQAVTLRAGSPTANFENALDRARAVAPRLMVRVDETSELDVLSAGHAIDRVVVLCGADDMAVVATYRTIKHLVSNPALRFDGASDGEGGDQVTAMGVAIMGAEAAAADDAIGRLNRATQTFLGRSVSYLACIPRMGPCSTSSLYRGEWTRSARELVEELVELWGTDQPEAIDAMPMAVEAPAPSPMPKPQIHVRRGVEPTPAPRAITQQPREAAAVREVAPTTPGAAMIAGLSVLATRSPYTPSVELACDAQGMLHLVATLSGADATAAFASEAVGKLLAVASWAGDHAELLALAHPQLSEDAIKSGPALHLLTDDPRAARGVLSTGVKVHMVASVTIQGRANWVCNALN